MIINSRYIDINSIYFGKEPPLTIGQRPGFELPDIDFTSPILDTRIVYQGPAHFYFAADGTLKMSAANEYPLEYRNGVAIGRHEPEPATVNYMRGNQYESIGPASMGTADWTYGGQVASVVPSPLGAFNEATSNPNGLLSGVYNEANSTFIAPVIASPSPTDYELITRTANNPVVSLLRWYVTRVSTTDYLYGRANAVPVGQIVASVIRKVDATNVHSDLAQLEMGFLATSPVITPLNGSASRPGSTLTILTNNAKQLTIYYSNGDIVQIDNPGATYTINQSTKNWSERYLQRISFI